MAERIIKHNPSVYRLEETRFNFSDIGKLKIKDIRDINANINKKAGVTILISGQLGSQQRKLLETEIYIKYFFKRIGQEGRCVMILNVYMSNNCLKIYETKLYH